MRYIMSLALILLLAVACAIPTTSPTRTPYPGLGPATPTPAATAKPTANPVFTSEPEYTDQDYIYTFESLVKEQGVPNITDQHMTDACLIDEYFGWPEHPSDDDGATTEDKLAVGYILSSTEPRYVRDVGIISGSMIIMPVDLRKRLCAEHR